MNSNEYHHAKGDLPHSALSVEAFNMAIEALKEPKHGEWKQTWHIDGNTKECSICYEGYINAYNFNFCPNCGADMRVKNELNRVSKELNSEIEKSNSEIEYKAKVKELEDAIAKCEKAEKDFKSRTCKFRSPTNCDFCSFHSECDEHWKEGDEK